MPDLAPYVRPATTADPATLIAPAPHNPLTPADMIRLIRELAEELHRDDQYWQRMVKRAVKAGEGP